MSVAKLSPYVLAVGVALSAASVEAQSFPSNVEVRIGGSERDPADTLFINKDQCETEGDAGKIRINVANLSNRPGMELLEFWVNSADGASCHKPEGRTWSGSGATQTTECTQIGGADEQINTMNEVLEFQARDLFTRDGKVCSLTSSQILYIVPLPSRTQNPGNVPEPAGADPIAIRFDVDVVPLSPPDSVRGGSGESEVSLRWDAVNSNDKLMKYQV
jgi:hypothetical protein